MLNIESAAESKFDGITVQIATPDGTMFVTINEDSTGKPIAVWINIGKAGATLAAWASGMARMISLALDKGATVNDICVELSSTTSDKYRMTDQGESVRSGVEGVWVALMKYKRDKFEQLAANLGDVNERGKGPRLGR